MRSVIFHNKRICDISANTQISIYTKYNREIKLQCTSDIYYLQRHIIITITYHRHTVRSDAEFIYIYLKMSVSARKSISDMSSCQLIMCYGILRNKFSEIVCDLRARRVRLIFKMMPNLIFLRIYDSDTIVIWGFEGICESWMSNVWISSAP